MKNIGINIRISESDYSVWSNGLRQNIFVLAKTLMLIGDYNVFVVNTADKSVLDGRRMDWDGTGVKVVQFDEIKDDLDVYFVMGAEIMAEDGHYLRKRGCKVVYYNCGNRYIIDMEEILFKAGTGKRQDESYLSEIWMIPQMMNTNYYYLETLERTRVREIPFVWSHEFIDAEAASLPNQAMYSSREGAKRVACFEPNLNVFKFALYDILIAERAYRQAPQFFSNLYVTNSLDIKAKERFAGIVNKLDLVRNGLASFEGRYRLPFFLSKYTDIVVAHQWENALNYAYLDALYLQYPLVHNAHLIKEAGYYYEGFNAQQGAEQLIRAAQEHDTHMDEYEERSQTVLARYAFDNPQTVAIYADLLRDLIAKGTTF